MQFIIDTIKESPNQSITFAEFMNLALYHPEMGYYSSGKVEIGSQGDFFTASSLGSDFGELLAEQFIEMWEVLGSPNPFTLVEVGAGAGFLASDILNYLQKKYPDFYSSINYIIIEKAPELIKQQQNLLKDFSKIIWQNWSDITDSSITGCIFSNELIDALPVHKIIIKNQQLQEIYVTVSEEKLQEVVQDISTPRLLDYFQLINIDLLSDDYPDNYYTEVNLNALDWLKTVTKKLNRGYILTIDYGYTAPKYYHPQRYEGTLKCYYQHRHHDNPYINIGEQDITTHVDFTSLENQGKLLGLETVGLTQQGLFLMGLGLGDRLSELSNGQSSLSEIFKRRDALHQLINPTGLGGFQVLIQSKRLTSQEQDKSLKGLKLE